MCKLQLSSITCSIQRTSTGAARIEKLWPLFKASYVNMRTAVLLPARTSAASSPFTFKRIYTGRNALSRVLCHPTFVVCFNRITLTTKTTESAERRAQNMRIESDFSFFSSATRQNGCLCIQTHTVRYM